MSIFVSYRRGQDSERVLTLVRALRRKFGASAVFHDSTSQLLDGKLKGYLLREITRCRAFLAVMGEGWGAERLSQPNDWVRFEIETVLSLNGVAIIPILVDDVPLPAREMLPDSTRALLDYRGFRLDFRRSEAIERTGLVARFVAPRFEAPAGFAELAGTLEQLVNSVARGPSWPRWPVLVALAASAILGSGQLVTSCRDTTIVNDDHVEKNNTVINVKPGVAAIGAEP
jgi:hypothetical protein